MYTTCEFASPLVWIAPDVVYLVTESPSPSVLSEEWSICPCASFGEVPTDEEVRLNDLPDSPSGAAIDVSKILIVFDAVSGNADGSAVECVLIDNCMVFDPVPVPDVYVCEILSPCVPPATLVLATESLLPSPQRIKKVAVTSFALVVSLSK